MPVLITALLPYADPTPADNDVVAGWGGFAVFVGLCIAVALIGFFLVRSLRTARRNLAEPEPAEDEDSPGGPGSTRDVSRDA